MERLGCFECLAILLLGPAAAEASLLFGRGFRAGIDRREQKKTAAEAEAEILRRQRLQSGGWLVVGRWWWSGWQVRRSPVCSALLWWTLLFA